MFLWEEQPRKRKSTEDDEILFGIEPGREPLERQLNPADIISYLKEIFAQEK